MLLIKNGRIKTVADGDIPLGYILFGDDGRIAEIGSGEYTGDVSEVIDAEGRLVTPGLVEAHCHVGFSGGVGSVGYGFNESLEPLTPEMRAIDGINPFDESFSLSVSHGVTAVCTGPGSCNVVAGTFAAIKTVGKRVDDMIIKYPVAMKCAFGENPTKCFGVEQKKPPRTKMGVAALLRGLLFKTKQYLEAKESGKSPAFDMKLEAMIPVIKGELPLKAHVHSSTDIFTVIRIAKEFGLGLTLDHCTDGALIAEELAAEGYPALVGPSFGGKSKRELDNKSFATAAALHRAGVKVSIITDSDVTPIQYLAMFAGFAVGAGLPYEEAWRAITVNPAESVGIGDRVGSLEVGKDGDAVIWNADPLVTVGASAYVTVIDGKVVYRADS
ncbi:MAG: amidohydrolase family protein [Clostridia bacterium]|nr:amidohydrolase family protein [Clostridia bacterium]